jgi:hypothetical protein
MAGPLLVILLLFLLRVPITALVKRLAPRVPAGARFLIAPLLATAFFTMSWASANADTAFNIGFLPQILFPVAIGLFTWFTVAIGPLIAPLLGPWWALRDKVPRPLRFVLLFIIPVIVSLLLTIGTVVTAEVIKMQFTVLLALGCGYLLLAPRDGDVAGAARGLAGRDQGTPAGAAA